MQAIKFKNFSTEDFTWSYDAIPYTFRAGQEIYLEEFKARHFAKHLIDRELNRSNIPTNMLGERAKLEVLALPGDEAITPLEALQEQVKEEIIEKKAKAKGKKKKEEEEFADLQD